MQKEKAEEIMSKILSEWAKRQGMENCSPDTIYCTYKTLLLSPHDDGLMPVSLYDEEEHLNYVYLVPIEEIILFGLSGKEVQKYPIKKIQ